jgi:hypothetical protein
VGSAYLTRVQSPQIDAAVERLACAVSPVFHSPASVQAVTGARAEARDVTR